MTVRGIITAALFLAAALAVVLPMVLAQAYYRPLLACVMERDALKRDQAAAKVIYRRVMERFADGFLAGNPKPSAKWSPGP